MTALISILIPTRNRPELAVLAIDAALHAGDEACEVVVADNGDVPLKLPWSDPRLRHLKPCGVLAMPANWERGLEAARGEWVMLLADKYMLVPGAIELLRRFATLPQRVITYGYGVLRQSLRPPEDSNIEALRAAGGTLQWPAAPRGARLCDSKGALAEIYARMRYPREYPMLYTALVHRSVIEAARMRTGAFFFGPAPDIASALQILAESEGYVATEWPVVLLQYPSSDTRWSNGAPASGGGLGPRFRAFLAEFGSSPLERDGIPPLSAGVVLATLIEFARRRPDLEELLRISWVEFAKAASREIEGHPLEKRVALHARLLRCTQKDRLRPRAAWVQARAAIAMHIPRRVLPSLLRLRRRLFPSIPPVEAPPAIRTGNFATRGDALDFLSRLLVHAKATASAPGLPQGDSHQTGRRPGIEALGE